MFEKIVLKVNDEVEIIDSLFCGQDYVEELSEYIGCIGTITAIDASDGNCEIVIENYDDYWFPPSCLRKIGDKKHITKPKIKPNTRVLIGKSLLMLDLVTSNLDIFETIEGDSRHIGDNNGLKYLYGKSGMITNKDYIHELGDDCYEYITKVDTYVGVEVEGNVYYLPQCVLFDTYPSYEPKKIKYDV